MAGVGPLSSGGGIYHAIIGTLEQVLIASLIAIPLGLLVAIYVTEYAGGALATAIRFLIDVMTGIPSIVAGLFILAFWVLALGQGFSGFAGGARARDPRAADRRAFVRGDDQAGAGQLREASYALGVPKWKTILRIVLPTAAAASSPASCSRSPASSVRRRRCCSSSATTTSSTPTRSRAPGVAAAVHLPGRRFIQQVRRRSRLGGRADADR